MEFRPAMEMNLLMIKIEIPNQVRDDTTIEPTCHAEFISASHSNLSENENEFNIEQ